jgi:hypothetical protein
VNAIALRLLLPLLDQADRGQDEEPAGQRRESNVAEVVPHQAEHRYQAQANPPRQAAQPIAQTHGISNWWSL